MTERLVVECIGGRCCGKWPYGPDHHGWDCPMSDPHGDVLRSLMDPSPNPILERARRDLLDHWGVSVEGDL